MPRRLMPRPRALRPIAGALIAIAVVGCAPPHTVVVGDRDVPTDILLKGKPAAAAAPLPVQPGFPIAPAPVAVSTGGATVPLPPTAAPPPPPQCPTASPLVGARDAATALPPGPPQAATYTYRQSGSYAIATQGSKVSGVYAPYVSHTISGVTMQPDGNGWSYLDTDSTGMKVTYDVYPQQRAAPGEPVSSDQAAATPIEAGIYVRTFTYKRADGTVDTLSPQPELLVAPFPLNSRGATWRSRGVDAATGIAIVVDGQIGLGKKFTPLTDRIDACGSVLQAYWVQYTLAPDNSGTTGVSTAGEEPGSSLQSPTISMSFVGTQVAFATQYGGIPLEQRDILIGSDGNAQVKIDRHESIIQTPALARSP